MDHEVDDATLVQCAQSAGFHAEEIYIVRQEVTSDGQEQRAAAGEGQRPCHEQQERTTIAEEFAKKGS
jgi:hypothetical protein